MSKRNQTVYGVIALLLPAIVSAEVRMTLQEARGSRGSIQSREVRWEDTLGRKALVSAKDLRSASESLGRKLEGRLFYDPTNPDVSVYGYDSRPRPVSSRRLPGLPGSLSGLVKSRARLFIVSAITDSESQESARGAEYIVDLSQRRQGTTSTLRVLLNEEGRVVRAFVNATGKTARVNDRPFTLEPYLPAVKAVVRAVLNKAIRK